MTKVKHNKLETGLTCKIDKNGRIHVFKTKEKPKKLKVSDAVFFALFLIASILLLIF